jgi:hypothetical protein
MSNQTPVDPMDLLKGAAEQGNLSPQSMTVAKAVLKAPDLAQMIMEAIRTPDDQIKKIQQTLLTLIVDDSGSIAGASNEDAVIEGHNHFIEVQKKGRYAEGILGSTIYLNGKVLNPYLPITAMTMMSRKNYQADGGTPLYDVVAATLLSVIAEVEKLEKAGASVRSQTFIISDGYDQHSHKCSAADDAKLVQDLLMLEGKHIVAALGIGDVIDWHKVYEEMGIRPQWILTSGGSSDKEIRAMFDNASRTSASALNSSSTGFTQQAMLGGFGGGKP